MACDVGFSIKVTQQAGPRVIRTRCVIETLQPLLNGSKQGDASLKGTTACDFSVSGSSPSRPSSCMIVSWLYAMKRLGDP